MGAIETVERLGPVDVFGADGVIDAFEAVDARFMRFFTFVGSSSARIEAFYMIFRIYAGRSGRNTPYECDFSHKIIRLTRYPRVRMWFFT